jgi:hypothetical protein
MSSLAKDVYDYSKKAGSSAISYDHVSHVVYSTVTPSLSEESKVDTGGGGVEVEKEHHVDYTFLQYALPKSIS